MQQRALDEALTGRTDMMNNNVEEAGTFEQRTMKKMTYYLPKIPNYDTRYYLLLFGYDFSCPPSHLLSFLFPSFPVFPSSITTLWYQVPYLS
jgi:hypothetical protein